MYLTYTLDVSILYNALNSVKVEFVVQRNHYQSTQYPR